jgi:hypothetical protein
MSAYYCATAIDALCAALRACTRTVTQDAAHAEAARGAGVRFTVQHCAHAQRICAALYVRDQLGGRWYAQQTVAG